MFGILWIDVIVFFCILIGVFYLSLGILEYRVHKNNISYATLRQFLNQLGFPLNLIYSNSGISFFSLLDTDSANFLKNTNYAQIVRDMILVPTICLSGPIIGLVNGVTKADSLGETMKYMLTPKVKTTKRQNLARS